MNSIGKIFARGLLTLIPVVLTVYILFTVFSLFESFLKDILAWLLPEHLYIPGLGFVLSILLVYLFGLLLNYYLTQRFIYILEQQLLKMPLIKAIYSPLRDLVQLFSKKDQSMGKPVLVHFEKMGFHAFGLVTREEFEDLGLNQNLDELVSVYIPLSYQLGGYTLLVPKSSIQPLDLPIEKAMTLAITGWIKSKQSQVE
jgi:uncharacterized membrane protein